MSKYCTSIEMLYSTAFFSYVVEHNMLELIAKEVNSLEEVIANNPEIIEEVAAPIYSDQEQIQLLNDIIKTLKLSKEFSNFIKLLAANQRLTLLSSILRNFKVIYSEYLGHKIVEVTVSQKLQEKDRSKLVQKLEETLAAKLELSIKEDPKILGGMIVKFNNKMLDASLESKFIYLTDAVKKKIALL